MTELLIRHVKKTRKNSRMVYAATGQAGNLKINGITWRDCFKFGFHFTEISKVVRNSAVCMTQRSQTQQCAMCQVKKDLVKTLRCASHALQSQTPRWRAHRGVRIKNCPGLWLLITEKSDNILKSLKCDCHAHRGVRTD